VPVFILACAEDLENQAVSNARYIRQWSANGANAFWCCGSRVYATSQGLEYVLGNRSGDPLNLMVSSRSSTKTASRPPQIVRSSTAFLAADTSLPA
jgi:hypothetical protein